MTLPKTVTDAAFKSVKSHTLALIKQLVPGWAQGMVQITDDEIRQVSNAAANDVVNAWVASQKSTSNTNV